MRLIDAKFEGFPYVEDGLTLEFPKESESVMMLAGSHACGKTILMKHLIFALYVIYPRFLRESRTETSAVFEDLEMNQTAILTVHFEHEGSRYCLESVLKKVPDEWEKMDKMIFSEEKLYFAANGELLMQRSRNQYKMVEDLSICFYYFGEEHWYPVCLVDDRQPLSPEIIELITPAFLNIADPAIQSLEIFPAPRLQARLTFHNGKKVDFFRPEVLRKSLSDGATKILLLLVCAWHVFVDGGYLFADDLFQHLDPDFVYALITAFQDPSLNQAGASLIFTTGQWIAEACLPDLKAAAYLLSYENCKISVSPLSQTLVSCDSRPDQMISSVKQALLREIKPSITPTLKCRSLDDSSGN